MDPNSVIGDNSSLNESHTTTENMFMLREYVIDITQNNKWSGYKKPYISKNLTEVLLLPEEQPPLTQIKENIIEELKESIIKGSAKSKEPSLARIEKVESDNYTRIEKAIEELKEKINNMSNLK
ncbi:4520_t:CDS:2 [Racocetra fulgida]|uniref:4520_t:CDS:1 n=1 Tax=Racocetra fulgida TaxID=60492 RepID=A0A9N9BZ09_9GLOM|nr:4520_t:CDS:2 [Racocetra fulgida]